MKSKSQARRLKEQKGWNKLKYRPLEDITAYELALCVRVIINDLGIGNSKAAYDELPPEAKRHFQEVCVGDDQALRS